MQFVDFNLVKPAETSPSAREWPPSLEWIVNNDGFCQMCGGLGQVPGLKPGDIAVCPQCGMSFQAGKLVVQGSNHNEVREVAEAFFAKAQEHVKVGEHLNSAKGLLYLIVGGALLAALCFIGAGLGLVYLGATGDSSIDLFGATVSSSYAGVVSIFCGAVILIIIFRQAMQQIEAILRIERSSK